jgi:hypothetical protein
LATATSSKRDADAPRILKRRLGRESRRLTDCGQSKYSAKVDFLRGKLSGYKITLLVCDRREINIGIFFGKFMEKDIYLLVRLKA